jgi:hypothetical protein
MNKKLIIIGVAAALAGTLGTVTVVNAQRSSGSQNNDAKSRKVSPRAIGGADAPSARLAALIDGTLGPFSNANVIRSKGVASVTRLGGGLYCIQPSVSLDVKSIVPAVSVDFSLSEGFGSLAQYRSSGSGCPSGNIAVRTFSEGEQSGRFVPSDKIAFTIIVP